MQNRIPHSFPQALNPKPKTLNSSGFGCMKMKKVLQMVLVKADSIPLFRPDKK